MLGLQPAFAEYTFACDVTTGWH